MFKVFIRTITLLIIGIATSIGIAKFMGQHLNPYQPLSAYKFNERSTESGTIFDAITYSSHTQFFEPQTPRTNYSERLGIGYSYERVDDVTYIYIERDNEDPQQIATLDTGIQNPLVTWRYDIEDPMYIIVNNTDEDSFTLYQLDVTTGEIVIHGVYPFTRTPVNVHQVYNEHLFVMRSGYFLAINLTTNAFYGDGIIGSPFNISYDRQWLHYSTALNPLDASMTERQHYILNLNSYEATAIVSPDADYEIAKLLSWSPTNLSLLIMDRDERLRLYDVETQTTSLLPPNLYTQDFITPWSYDGDYIVLIHILDDELTYGIYDLATQGFLELFSIPDTRSPYAPPPFYNIQWSPDQRWVLATYYDNAHYQIYDASTGDLVLDRPIPNIDGSEIGGSMTWVWDSPQ